MRDARKPGMLPRTVKSPLGLAEVEEAISAVTAAYEKQAAPPERWASFVDRVLRCPPRHLRAVVLGGGTGMSTVVGGGFAERTRTGGNRLSLKAEFGRLDVIACTTDDGGSTGELLKYLPVIGIGDLRKSCAALIKSERLQTLYDLSFPEADRLRYVLQQLFQFRSKREGAIRRLLRHPELFWPGADRPAIPRKLGDALRKWGCAFDRLASEKGMPLSGHCVGNLLLIGAIRCAGWIQADVPPTARQLQKGLDLVAETIGAAPGCLHVATHVPGQLCFRYANGVDVIGQSKAGQARRGFPIDFVYGLYGGNPVVAAAVRRVLSKADVIVCAPGSLYSSMIPVLQLPEITEAIRANRKALKVLAANFWIQEGETDISPQHFGRGFFVSDILKAYEQNIPGGTHHLFDVVLCSNLEHLPGNVLRQYALEGKRPIHLDRAAVEEMGYRPVEAMLFAEGERRSAGVIHHDPGKFALAIRTLLCARRAVRGTAKRPRGAARDSSAAERAKPRLSGTLPCRHRERMCRILETLHVSHQRVRESLSELVWQHRDIRPEHFCCLERVVVIPAEKWRRSVEWDNVLAYYEPDDATIYLHASLLRKEHRLQRDILIALGESLLGNYIQERMWTDLNGAGRCYSIRLRPHAQRRCFLDDDSLRTYLALARLTPDANAPDAYRIVVNNGEGFLPPGLLFGLMYAWYLDNAYGGVMEYEMSLLRWPESALIPYQAAERRRKASLVRFFRCVVFGHDK